MSDEAKAIMKSKHFTWALGMRTTAGRRISWESGGFFGGLIEGDARVRPDNGPVTVGELPDLEDPGTVALLWAVLSVAVNGSCRGAMYPRYEAGVWSIDCTCGASGLLEDWSDVGLLAKAFEQLGH